VDPVPDTILLRKSGRAMNRTSEQQPIICLLLCLILYHSDDASPNINIQVKFSRNKKKAMNWKWWFLFLQHSKRPVTHEGHTLFPLFSFALGDVEFSFMVLCDPCRRGITIQQYVVQIVSSAENVTCCIVKANEVWVKMVRQIDNLYAYYFVLHVYACKVLISFISKNS
jgi:hypothetical protein